MNVCISTLVTKLTYVIICELSASYGCGKIVTLLFLSIYSLLLQTPHFLGPHDTLPCVLMVKITYRSDDSILLLVK